MEGRNMAAGRFESLYVFLRMLLGLVFVWAASNKIMDPGGFAAVIENYMILPDYLINIVAVLLPWLEALCGLLLITGYLVRGSTVIVNLLLIVFISALSLNIFRGIDINCGCFSLEVNSDMNMYHSLLWDLPVLAVGLWLFFFSLKSGNAPRLCEIVKNSK